MAKKSGIHRSSSRAAPVGRDDDDEYDETHDVPDPEHEAEAEPESRPKRGRTDRRSSIVQLQNMQYEEFLERVKEDPRGVFNICENVCKEALESLEHLQQEHQQVFEEAVAHRDIALRERDTAVHARDRLAFRLT